MIPHETSEKVFSLNNYFSVFCNFFSLFVKKGKVFTTIVLRGLLKNVDLIAFYLQHSDGGTMRLQKVSHNQFTYLYVYIYIYPISLSILSSYCLLVNVYKHDVQCYCFLFGVPEIFVVVHVKKSVRTTITDNRETDNRRRYRYCVAVA